MLGQLNTSFDGAAVFAGDNAASPMQSGMAANGAVNATLAATLVSNGGAALTAANVPTLVGNLQAAGNAA